MVNGISRRMKLRTTVKNVEDHPERLEIFLDYIRSGYSPGDSARKARVARRAIMNYIKEDKEFEAEYLDALDEGTDYLEGVARRRAVRDSDRLLIFLLQSRNREKYGNGTAGTVSTNVQIDFAAEAASVRDKLAGLAKRARDKRENNSDSK